MNRRNYQRRYSAKSRKPKHHDDPAYTHFNKMVLFGTILLVLAFSILIAYTLFRIQIVDHDRYVQAAAGQHYSRAIVQPARGGIFDANGVRIAGTKTIYRVGITPEDVRSYTKSVDETEIVEFVALRLGIDSLQLHDYLTQVEESYIFLAKDVEETVAVEIRDWLEENNVGGFRFDAEAERVYNNNDLAGQVVGYTRFDEGLLTGALGVELEYDDLLRGTPGYSYAKRDNFLSAGVVPYFTPTGLSVMHGADLYLTIQLGIQRILQEELLSAAAAVGLTAGVTGIVMDPWNGEILGMAQLPTMQSSDPFAAPPPLSEESWENMGASQIDYLMSSVWRNQNVSDVYEPGSTMKAITAAIGFELGVTDEDKYYNDDPIEIRGHKISCFYEIGHGLETFRDGFVRSCNPVFVHLGEEIGVDRYLNFFREFGFHERTGIDLPAEARAILHTEPTDLDFANLTFGESFAVSPIQMLSAYASLANGGYRISPHIVREAVRDNTVVFEGPSALGGAVVSTETCDRVKALMREVALTGSNYSYGSEGYEIGGKTSTSTDEDDGGHTYSYMAMAPLSAPRVVAMIVLHKPTVAGLTSLCAVRPTNRLISRVLDYLGEERTLSETDIERLSKPVVMPNVIGMPMKEAASVLQEAGLASSPGNILMLPDDSVRTTVPAVGTPVAAGSCILLYRDDSHAVEYVAVPDFTGRTFFECHRLAEAAGLYFVPQGRPEGAALGQSPTPESSSVKGEDESGAPTGLSEAKTVRRGDVITVYFESLPGANEITPNEAGN